MPGDPEAYTGLVDRVPLLSATASPPMTAGSRPRGRLATIASRVTTGIQGAVSAVTGIVIIVIGWALFALNKLDILSAVGRTPYTGGPSAAGRRSGCAWCGANSGRAGVSA